MISSVVASPVMCEIGYQLSHDLPKFGWYKNVALAILLSLFCAPGAQEYRVWYALAFTTTRSTHHVGQLLSELVPHLLEGSYICTIT